ncbi:organoarsenical effux MFS transporter ArsJ [Aliidiomarina halalkaliphila]|uniref:Organoarsenical effux MFS transporter ArsJ n=1 Tax=Aliidiomarina halalkaliphila TaxID=2593535 RepID=A0A552X5J3_9GAMM|nr:organoarsenical effux MFS transporter ArsJ [Aliidiomarina halalkaliphila]TRW50229.1 organoarsenical effux MFS transporter ArsJ [Aliidiomarina halalkaliphila]
MNLQQYLVITGNYWAFTLTDGALRMLVVLFFHQLGYSPLEIAMLFIFYEFFGVVTNLLGGYLGARIGLNRTMQIGLVLQIIALAALTVPTEFLTIVWVMAAQAISGIAKDLNKMSAKSAIKLLVPDNAQSTLYKWVAILTGSKNALKGVGFFLGGLLLTLFGFVGALYTLMALLLVTWLLSLIMLQSELGKAKAKPKFNEIFSKSRAINILSAARMFLFGARDVWFVIALPVVLSQQFNWDHWQVGAFLAIWVIFYGFIQGIAPRLTGRGHGDIEQGPSRNAAVLWAAGLTLVPLGIALLLNAGVAPQWVIVIGLLMFAFMFAVNSSLHSYLIIRFANADGVSLDVGFYYMANAMGRLIGTVLSGLIFQTAGFVACLLVSVAFLATSTIIVRRL